MPLNIAEMGKIAGRTIDGIYLDIHMGTCESLVGNAEGIFKTRSIHRKAAEQNMSLTEIMDMRGRP